MDASNAELARTFERVAELLELESANPFRVHAWRHAAQAIHDAPSPVAQLVREHGDEALSPQGVGRSLGAALRELVETGQLRTLVRLEAQLPPVERFQRIPGIGPDLARRLYEKLHVETLEDLEVAAHDGALETVPGFGPRRIELVRAQLAGMLSRRVRGPRRPRVRAAPSVALKPALPEGLARHPTPGVDVLLAVDAEYLRRAREGSLPKLAPKRFNPAHERWLPVLDTAHGELRFHALFSNTARAHELGTTHDWVVIYWGDDGRENQCTVVTETRGALKGKRVVRGHEAECARFYGS